MTRRISGAAEMKLGSVAFGSGILAAIAGLRAVVILGDPSGWVPFSTGVALLVVGALMVFHGNRADRAQYLDD